MKRRGLQVTDHTAVRWVQRVHTDPRHIPEAWRQAVYVGQVRRSHRSLLLGYQWAQWVFVVSWRPAARGRHEQWVLVSVWPATLWQRAERHYQARLRYRTGRRDRMKIQRRTKEE
jgi:hypothetical protein